VNLKKLISLILLALVVLTGGLSLATSNSSKAGESAVYPVLAGELEPAGVPADGANLVDIGMYGTNVYELSFEDYTFYFTGYIWLRWEGDLDPVSSLEFVNAVETWGLMVTSLTEEPEQLATSEYVQTLSVQGRFYKAFQLKDYPLDSQSLSIMIEDTTNTADKIQYRADSTQTGLDPNFKVQGYEVNGVSAQNYLHSYGTDFGDTGTSAKQTYSTSEFQIQIDRNSNLFVWKLLLPLLLVLITNRLTLLMNPK
jgi:hypothetical protein